MPPPIRGARPSLLLAVFLISLAALGLQVLQIRIFAFALWHHLAFLVISIAILGFGAAGAFTASIARLRPKDPSNAIGWAGIAFAITALIGARVLAIEPVDVFAQIGIGEIVQVALYYLVFAAPYFCAGYIISLALAYETKSVPRLYFINLTGSGVGCFLIFATLSPLGAEGSMLVFTALGSIVAVIAGSAPVVRGGGALLTVLLLAGIPFAEAVIPVDAADSKLIYKELSLQGAMPRLSKWTPFSRIDVIETQRSQAWAVFQDGDAPTLIPRVSTPTPESNPRAFPYRVMGRQPETLMIGCGAGGDLKAAVDFGAKHVTGVEINPFTLGLSQDPELNATAHLINDDPRVDTEIGEGRFFVRSSEETYDLIQLAGVDTYTALASGAYVLTESYLYTREAFHDYLDHLGDDGMVSIHRFAFPAPRETLRTMVIAMEVLEERGVAEPWNHVVVARHPWITGIGGSETTTTIGSILIKKTPFTKEELDRARAFSKRMKLLVDYLPDEKGQFTPEALDQLNELKDENPNLRDYKISPDGKNPFYSFRDAFRNGRRAEFFENYPYDVRTVSDDSPYFFNQHRLGAVWDWLTSSEEKVEARSGTEEPWMAMTFLFQTKPLGLILLFLTLAQLLVLASVCIFGPLLTFRRAGIRSSGMGKIMGYFACLGVAYIFLQISAMQRFGLILGHPTYAISVVMASFLVSSGVGSLFSARFPIENAAKILRMVVGVLIVAALFYQLALPTITNMVLPQPLLVRAFIIVLLIAPLGFFMGMCFPTGIRMLEGRDSAIVAWAYGVNGAASVLGSVITVVLAIGLGFAMIQWIATGIYVLAALLMAASMRTQST